LFQIEAIDLAFSNGRTATFECMRTTGDGVVMVAAINENDELVMVREYGACLDRFELGFVKGKIDPGESADATALRELKEEIGFGAHDIRFLKTVSISPAYTDFVTHLYLATSLFPEALAGDEIEPLEQICWPIADLDALYQHPEVNDARVLLLLSMLEKSLLTDSPK